MKIIKGDDNNEKEILNSNRRKSKTRRKVEQVKKI